MGGREVAQIFEQTTWARRVRSLVLLALLLVVLGVLTAAGVGSFVVLMGSLLDQALE